MPHHTRARIHPLRTAAALGVTAALGAAAVPAAAEASRIVYTCAPNLCVVDPDTGASAPLTTDGATLDYRFPSVTRNGATLAAVRGSDVLVGGYGGPIAQKVASSRDINGAAIAPDGTGVGESHSYVENRFGCPTTGGCLELVDVSESTYTRIGAPPESGYRVYNGGAGVGFLGAGAFLAAKFVLETPTTPSTYVICVAADPAGATDACADRITSPTTLNDPTGSPDGTLIAAAVGDPAPAKTTSVVLFDAATGAVVRKLADAADSPTFSPDGKRVAYAGADGFVSVVPIGGGTPKRLAQGVSPTWGDGAGPAGPATTAPGAGGGGSTGPKPAAAAVSVRSTSLRYRRAKGRRKATIVVTVSCTAKTTCRGTLRIKKGTTVLGKRSYAVKAGRRASVAVTPSASGRRSLARARKHQVAVVLQPKGGPSIVKKLTLRR